MIHKGIENGEFDPVVSIDDMSRFMISFLDGIAISAITLTHGFMQTGKQIDLFENSMKSMLNVKEPDLSQR
ncbi:hypothetical protein DMO16_23785 [Fictibacillus sp. S7]|nr:hypothetical protein DMO16_23785 [Fictibacillus sp. S7]